MQNKSHGYDLGDTSHYQPLRSPMTERKQHGRGEPPVHDAPRGCSRRAPRLPQRPVRDPRPRPCPAPPRSGRAWPYTEVEMRTDFGELVIKQTIVHSVPTRVKKDPRGYTVELSDEASPL